MANAAMDKTIVIPPASDADPRYIHVITKLVSNPNNCQVIAFNKDFLFESFIA